MVVRWSLVVGVLLAITGDARADRRGDPPEPVRLAFDATNPQHVAPYPELGVEIPWIWHHIRRAVTYSEQRLPHHSTEGFSVLVAPCVVSNGFDRVAGLGIEGYF